MCEFVSVRSPLSNEHPCSNRNVCHISVRWAQACVYTVEFLRKEEPVEDWYKQKLEVDVERSVKPR